MELKTFQDLLHLQSPPKVQEEARKQVREFHRISIRLWKAFTRKMEREGRRQWMATAS